MVGKARKNRLFSLITAAALLLSVMGMPAMAAGTEMEEAKASLATVDITQVYNGKEVDAGIHNYSIGSREVNITYEANLYMTDLMAGYLTAQVDANGTPRQTLLMDAKFNVNINIDNLSLLEFNPESVEEGKVTLTFASTFLKPAAPNPDDADYAGYSYELARVSEDEVEVKDKENGETFMHVVKVFEYDIKVPKDWIEGKESFTIPMELISYYEPGEGENPGTAYSYQEVKAKYPDKLADMRLMYEEFIEADWMYEIKLSLGDFRVADGVAETITESADTWKTITAQGTVDGTFSYIGEPATSIAILLGYEEAGYVTTVDFGTRIDDPDAEPDAEPVFDAWKSNKVTVKLKYEIIDAPESPVLNLDDHFAYIIGYPDGMVHPEGSITRAEVATIFFRMLKDEARNTYWSQSNPYSDVDSDDWYNNAISTLTNLGVIEGYPDGTFQPNGSITRAEFAAIAVRFFDGTENLTWDKDAFSDIENHWANGYINKAYLLELVDGYEDGTFRPQNDITRAEAMTIVNNTLRRSPVNEGLLPVEDMITWPDNANTGIWYYAAVQEATNSHEYDYFEGSGSEKWTEELPVRDWAAFEKAWSDANSAANPGDVVDGD